MGKKKKFIDKKKSATFHLIARDSSDPNFNQDPGNDRVFVRVDNNPFSVERFNGDDDPGNSYADADADSIFADAPGDEGDGEDNDTVFGSSMPSRRDGAAAHPLPEHVRREILELGFPDDGYNYLIHLREIKNTGGGSAYYHNPKAKLEQLPRDVKAYDASRIEISKADADLDNKTIFNVGSKAVGARVQKVVDPEVAALLDDSDASRFGSDAEDLEEDFVVRANLPEDGEEYNGEENIHSIDRLNSVDVSVMTKSDAIKLETACHSQVADNLGFLDGISNHPSIESVYNVEERPRVRRLLDEQFDLLESQEYGSDDNYDYNGYASEEDASLAEKLKHALNGNEVDDLELYDDNYKAPADILLDKTAPKSKELMDYAADIIQRCIDYAEKYENEDDNNKDVLIVEESSDESEAWDCETVVSTYSNLDNHPGEIKVPEVKRKKKLAETFLGALSSSNHKITLGGKEKLPVDFLPYNKKPSAEKVKVVGTMRTEQYKRKPHGQESKEERKERKAAVKEERREARRAKKEMKGLYRCEAQRAQRVAATSVSTSVHIL